MNSTSDPEIQAMNTIVETLEALAEPQRANVLRYINGRYGGRAPAPRSGAPAGEPGEGAAAFADLGDLFDKANPQNQADRVLVVAYWKQVIEGAESFEAFPVSKELKHLGHGVTNITSALDSLIQQSPKLVLQVAKSGKSRQARKRYKVTREGVRRVQAMVNQVQDEGEGS
jgi:hypothetical protein